MKKGMQLRTLELVSKSVAASLGVETAGLDGVS